MTIPNVITIIRLLLIPVFVTCVMYYASEYQEGHVNDALRMWAAVVFIAAAVSDGVDGYIARKFNQRSELGAVLDPLADKLLQVTALILLSWDFGGAFHRIPLWLPILMISRDLFILVGYLVIKLVVGAKVELKIHWSGKVATALSMVLIAMVLLQWTDEIVFPLVLYTVGACVAISLVIYVESGILQINKASAKG